MICTLVDGLKRPVITSLSHILHAVCPFWASADLKICFLFLCLGSCPWSQVKRDLALLLWVLLLLLCLLSLILEELQDGQLGAPEGLLKGQPLKPGASPDQLAPQTEKGPLTPYCEAAEQPQDSN